MNRIIFGLSFLFLSVEAFSNASTLREQCRTAISGYYLNLYDTRVREENTIRDLKNKLELLDKAIKEQKAILTKRKVDIKNGEYDLKKENAKVAAQNRYDLMLQTRQQNQELLKNAQKRYGQAKEDEKQAIHKIKKVFNIVKLENHVSGRYPFRIDYQSKCPKYRFMCPIPKKEALALLNIVDDDKAFESCRKYASYSGVE